jgi:2-oxoglutarate dehydrogenase E2 component (dihydrolipoamide succinyltransferase)
MNRIEVILPKMGESIIEATILKWNKQVGETISADEVLLEIATDKVDSDIVSPSDGVVSVINFKVGDVVKIGSVIAVLNDNTNIENKSLEDESTNQQVVDSNESNPALNEVHSEKIELTDVPFIPVLDKELEVTNIEMAAPNNNVDLTENKKYISPLVRSIAKQEKISEQELDLIQKQNSESRIKKSDILFYIENKGNNSTPSPSEHNDQKINIEPLNTPSQTHSGEDEIIQLDRMRKLIAQHMVMSKQVSPHVTSFVEVDVTNIVKWRDSNKDSFLKSTGEKITYTPIFIEAVVKAIKDFPKINASLDGDNLIIKKDINIGMAAALPSGNLIVPVIKKANHLSLPGLTAKVNDLANKARNNKLSPEDIQDGTFTITNVGTFGNLTGTPIINQPQLAIIAVGEIKKKPVVIETEQGDMIAIRHMMMMSMSYDHRVIDGLLGGSFLKRVGDYMEKFKGI